MHSAALPARVKHLRDRRFQPEVGVGDHKLDPAQTASSEITQELEPERLGFARADRQAHDFPYAIGVYGDGDYHRNRHMRPAWRTFTYVASIHRYGQSPSSGRVRNAFTRSSIAAHNRDT